MSRILDLKAKRAAAWEEAKKLLDKHDGGVMDGEDLEAYERMEADIDKMGREIEALERAEALEAKLKEPTSEPITGEPSANTDKTGIKSADYKNAFLKAMRTPNIQMDVKNALQVGTDSEGGYLVPDEFEQTIIDGLKENNIMRGISRIIQTSSGDRKIPVVASHGTAAWTDEEALITESDDTFSQVTLSAYKITTMIKISNELLNDSVFNMETYIANELSRRLGTTEEEAFLVGNGTNRPTGIFASSGGGEVGATAASATAITFDEIYDLYYSLKGAYRRNATWIMNDTTVKAIRKLKDGNGQYLWQPAGMGTPDTLLNVPILTSSYVPEISSGNTPIAFGDFSYYWIADRQGHTLQRLNELYAANGQTGFIAKERVDGKLVLPEAVKILKMGA